MRRLVALTTVNEDGSLDEDAADAMVAKAQEYAAEVEAEKPEPDADAIELSD